MERRSFIKSGAIGLSLLNMPNVISAQSNAIAGLEPFNIKPRQPLMPGAGNADIRTIIQAKQTGMQFSNVEVAFAPKQMGPSPHTHDKLDELMYVLEGTATVMIGDKIFEVEAGGWNFRPRGITHTFWNASDKPLRFIDCFFNQNFEDYLEELFHKIIPEMVSKSLAPDAPIIAKQIATLDKKFGIKWFHNLRQGIIDKYNLHG